MRMNKMIRVIVKVIMVLNMKVKMMVLNIICISVIVKVIMVIKFISVIVRLVSITPGHVKLD